MSNLHQMTCDQDEGSRKRSRNEICKDSRKRVKQDTDMFKGVVGKLNDEIEELEKEIRSLDQEGSRLRGKLENLETKEAELKGQIDEKEKEVVDQNDQLNKLSTSLQVQPVISIYDLETLRKEFEVWTQTTTWDNWESEKSELEKEILELRTENSKLQAEYSALVQWIVQDWEQGNEAGY